MDRATLEKYDLRERRTFEGGPNGNEAWIYLTLTHRESGTVIANAECSIAEWTDEARLSVMEQLFERIERHERGEA